MGAKASKPAQAATRKFPARAPGSAVPPRAAPPPPRPQERAPKASLGKDDAIRADAMNPDPNPSEDADFSSRLKQMGVATPNPTFSNSSIANPTSPPPSYSAQPHSASRGGGARPNSNPELSALHARQRFQELADAEAADPSGRRAFLDVGTVRHILDLRARGTPAADIEARLRLKSGVVARLGKPGIVAPLD